MVQGMVLRPGPSLEILIQGLMGVEPRNSGLKLPADSDDWLVWDLHECTTGLGRRLGQMGCPVGGTVGARIHNPRCEPRVVRGQASSSDPPCPSLGEAVPMGGATQCAQSLVPRLQWAAGWGAWL